MQLLNPVLKSNQPIFAIAFFQGAGKIFEQVRPLSGSICCRDIENFKQNAAESSDKGNRGEGLPTDKRHARFW